MAPLGGVFSARVVLRAGEGENALFWYNNHEFSSANPTLSDLDITVITDALSTFHRELLLSCFRLDRIIISSYAEDGKPYDPDTFAVREVNLPGFRFANTAITGALPLTQVVRVERAVARGRSGRLLLRGLLTEGDIQSDPLSGRVTLSDTPALQSLVAGAFGDLVDALEGAETYMCMARGPEDNPDAQLRIVQNLIVKGLGSKQLRNKVSPRYGGGLFGNILRAIEAVKDSAPALEAIASVLNSLGWLAPILTGAAAAASEQQAVKDGPSGPLAQSLTE